MAKVVGFDHVSILVKDAQASLAFYQRILGLNCLDRPNLDFKGYWLDLGAGQSLHIMQLPNPCEQVDRPDHGGQDQHFALRVDRIDEFVPLLVQQNIAYTRSRSGRNALFFRDLDHNAIELFEAG
ncbi:VOC family protein [Thiomicrospira sp.]|uniref:VOC family protein n=1 Tax=Thiomicrospira sp. TaxID=935 RepID=UPI002F93806F